MTIFFTFGAIFRQTTCAPASRFKRRMARIFEFGRPAQSNTTDVPKLIVVFCIVCFMRLFLIVAVASVFCVRVHVNILELSMVLSLLY